MVTSTVRRRPAVPLHRGESLRLPRRGDAPDPSDLATLRRWARCLPRPRAVDLFCGAGGLSLGLQHAGFSIVLGADADPWAVETHSANVGGLGWVGDLSEPTELLEYLAGCGIDSVELVAGGVPCQPFSRAGQAKLRELARSGVRINEARAGLWRSFITVVEHLEPDAVLVENVPDLAAWEDGAVLSGFLDSLAQLNYTVDARILDCYRHGVPQHRSRLVLLGTRGGRAPGWPEPSDTPVTLRDAIGDLPPVPGGQRASILSYRPRPGASSEFSRRMREDLPAGQQEWIHDHMTRAVRPDDWEGYVGLREGQTYADLPGNLQRYRNDIFTDKYKRLRWDERSRTITAHIAKDGYGYIHPEQHRTLSIREAARLQTFPDSFRFAGQPSHRYTQIGNAVPPALASAVGRALLHVLRRPPGEIEAPSRTREDLLSWHVEFGAAHPWRRAGADPWMVLAAELILGRAPRRLLSGLFDRLATLAPTPHALVDAFGDPAALARALGVPAAAGRRLLRAADSVLDLFAGELPDDDLALRLVPGVGDSAARSVTCFAFGHRTALLDVGTARVSARYHGRDDLRRWQQRLDLQRLAGPGGPDGEFNGALLDLATHVCRPDRPLCDVCPLATGCVSARLSPHLTTVA